MKNNSQNNNKRARFITDETIKNFLKKNNVSLEHLGDEKKQEEYIKRLSRAMKELKASNRFLRDDDKDSVDRRSEALAQLGEVVKEGNLPKNVQEKLTRVFIPFNPKEEKNDLDIIKSKMKELESENKKLMREIEKLKEKINEQNPDQEQEPDQEPEPKEAFIDPNYNIFGKDSSGKSDVIETKGELVDKRDETAKDVLKSMMDYHKSLQKSSKESDSLDIVHKKNKSIMAGVKRIFEITSSIQLKTTSRFLSGVVVTGGIVGATGYVATRVAGKTVKGVAKLGVMSIKGAATLTGIAGKLIFKGAKGAAKKCKAKADKIRSEKNQTRLYRTEAVLAEMDEATKQVLDFANNRLSDSIVSDDLYADFTSIQLKHLKDIQDNDTREVAENEINTENRELLVKAKEHLRYLKLAEISSELKGRFSLEDSDIRKFVSGVQIDENGELVIKGGSPVTLEQLEEAGLDELLKRVVQVPNVKAFDFEDISNISYLLSNPDELDNLKSSGEIKEGVLKFVELVRDENVNNDYFIEDLDYVTNRIESNNYILQEAYSRDLFEIAKELRAQSLDFSNEYIELSKSNKYKDSHRRETLRKVAEAKLNDLKDSGIIETVQKDDEKQVRILAQAERALSYDLTEDIEHTVDLKKKKTEKRQENTDHGSK